MLDASCGETGYNGTIVFARRFSSYDYFVGIANNTCQRCTIGADNGCGIGLESIDVDGFTLFNKNGYSGTLYYVAVKL